jgi:hypothetical protein
MSYQLQCDSHFWKPAEQSTARMSRDVRILCLSEGRWKIPIFREKCRARRSIATAVSSFTSYHI